MSRNPMSLVNKRTISTTELWHRTHSLRISSHRLLMFPKPDRYTAQEQRFETGDNRIARPRRRTGKKGGRKKDRGRNVVLHILGLDYKRFYFSAQVNTRQYKCLVTVLKYISRAGSAV